MACNDDRGREVLEACRAAGLTVYEPEGAYYVMTDVSPLGWTDDTAFVQLCPWCDSFEARADDEDAHTVCGPTPVESPSDRT